MIFSGENIAKNDNFRLFSHFLISIPPWGMRVFRQISLKMVLGVLEHIKFE